MIKSQFSEKFYEFMVNHELLNKYSLNIFIPSQNQEASLGFDVLFQGKKVGLLMLQYKVVEKYLRNPKYLYGDSYKFKLHKNPKSGYYQHNALVYWNTIPGCNAFYVVPDYIDYMSFNRNYMLGTIFNSSRIFKPTRYISDYRSHYINFDSKKAFRHSVENIEMDSITASNFENILSSIEKRNINELMEEVSNFIDSSNFELSIYAKLNKFLYDNDMVLMVFE